MEELREQGRQGEARGRGAGDRRGPARADPAPRYGAKLDEATQVPEKLARQDAIEAVEEEALAELARRRRRRRGRPREGARGHRAPSRSSRRTSSAGGSRSTRSGPTGAPRTRSGRSRREVDIAPRVHGSALFTRGETQILSNVALGTTRMDMKVDNLGLAGDEDLLAPLQLPAVLGRGGRLHARPEAPRHRPRRARRAGAGADDPGRGGVPLRDPGRLRHARVQRLLVDGLGLRLVDGAAGRGRAGLDPGRRRRDGPDQGGRRLHRAHRHRRRRGPPRRHGLQGRRHRRTGSPPCRWTSRSPASPSRSSRDALEQARKGRLFILDKMAETIDGAARAALRRTRRRSSRSRSTRRRSAP